MDRFKAILLILYLVIGVSLIGFGLVKKIKAESGEVIDNLKQFKIVYKLSNIFFGLSFLVLGYLYYIHKIHGGILFLTIPITEILQRCINNHYIQFTDEVEERNGETQLGKDINIDEILDEDYFENRKQDTLEEIKEENIVDILMNEGIEQGIFSNDLFDIFKLQENHNNQPKKSPIEKVSE